METTTFPAGTAHVGEFHVSPAGDVWGPAEYMKERWPAFRTELEAGRSAVFNFGGARSTQHLIAVAVQTDYAGWRGMRNLFGGSGPF